LEGADISDPLVSVIIPCFNSEKFVADAVRSALNQDWPRTEVIAVDDGSTDQTVEILRSFNGLIRWSTGPNRGACAARNRGISMAHGDYVQFLDSDDLLYPQKITRSMSIIQGSRNALVYSLQDIVNLDPDRPAPFQWNRIAGNEDPIDFMLSGDLPTPAPLHRRSILEDIGGFDEALPCAQDREFHMRMALKGVEFILLPEVLFTIRRREGSLGSGHREEMEKQRGRIAWNVYKELQASDRLTEKYRLGCAALLMKSARGLIRTKPIIARQFIDQAKLIHPSGGVERVYSKSARVWLGVLGPRLTENLAAFVRHTRSLRLR